MIAPEDLKLILAYLQDEKVDTEELEKLTKKLELIVKQIEVQDKANEELGKIREELANL